MREIKFRAWNNGVMCYVEKILDFKGSMHLILDNPKVDFFGNHYGANITWAELMQYTGLNDKNDKEIYEGDIVIVANKIMTIRYMKDSFQCIDLNGKNYRLFDFVYIGNIKVIGNIYDNSELLDGDK